MCFVQQRPELLNDTTPGAFRAALSITSNTLDEEWARSVNTPNQSAHSSSFHQTIILWTGENISEHLRLTTRAQRCQNEKWGLLQLACKLTNYSNITATGEQEGHCKQHRKTRVTGCDIQETNKTNKHSL